MKQKYSVTVHAEITLRGIEVEVDLPLLGNDDLAEQAVCKWLQSISGLYGPPKSCASAVAITNECIEERAVI